MQKDNNIKMTQEDASIRVRLTYGSFAFEYEGSRNQMKETLSEILELIASAEVTLQHPHHEENTSSHPKSDGEKPRAGVGAVTEYAKKLKAKTGSDLIRAAAAYLTFEEGKEKFTAEELRRIAKKASGFWKDSYGKNFTAYVKRMIQNDILRDMGSGNYSLSYDEHKKLKSEIGIS